MLLFLIALWVRSYFVADFVNYSGRGRNGQVWFNNGQLIVQMISTDFTPREGGYTFSHSSGKSSANAHLSWWRRHGVDWRAGPMDGPDRGMWDRVLTAPMWLIACITAGAPSYLLWRARRVLLRGERARRGLCIACGYDLRGTPAQCPECGRVTRETPYP
ncbi:MAG: hypothetical protein WBD40_10605 [Tepidisphaeraceae bacterium]